MTEHVLHPFWSNDELTETHQHLFLDWNKLSAVTFEQVKNQIKSGDIIAYTGTSLKSKLLRIITNSPISHVGIALILHNKLYILHSNADKGVCMDPLEKDFPFLWIRHNLVWTSDHLIKSIQVLPAGYDMKSIILSGILNTKLNKPQPIPLKTNFMCSDLVSYIWDLHQQNLFPQQIVEWFMFQAKGSAYLVLENDIDNKKMSSSSSSSSSPLERTRNLEDVKIWYRKP